MRRMTLAVTAPGYRGDPPPRSFNIARHCLTVAGADPDKTALHIAHDATDRRDDERWSYARLADAVLRFAAALGNEGIAPGDRVLVRLGNSVEMAIAFLAANAAGAVPIPASSLLSAAEVEFLADDSDARLVVAAADLPVGKACDGRLAVDAKDIPHLIERHAPRRFAATAADDPGFLIYTSGTTAKPKGVLHAQRALWGRRPMYRGWYGLRREDVILHAGALNWTYTLGTGFIDPLTNGATAVIFAGERRPEAWPALLERVGATLFAAVPTVYRQILKYCDVSEKSFPTLRHGLTAGEALRPEVAAEWQARTGRSLYEAFGMSEVSTYVSSSPDVPPKPGSPGRPQDGRAVALLPIDGGVEPVAIGGTGIVAVHRSDPGLMLRYWNRSDGDTFRGGWFVTGDLAEMDADFYLWPKGRDDDLMNVLGYRVSPAEVEEALTAHPAVAEAAAVAVEVRPGVSIIRAFVVAEEGGEVEPDDILAHAYDKLATYKLPREVVMIEALPRTANGKVRRDVLRREAT